MIKLSIPKHLTDKVKSIPEKPGIYQMKDSDGNIIYIGKSKCLNKRVRSYFYNNHQWNKIKRMVFNIYDIDFIVTDTHLEAQILECALIKKIKPTYNSQFKNDKKYAYLKIEDYNKFRSLSVTQERETKYCFGPYRSKNNLLDLVDYFKNIYPIKKHENSYEFTYHPLPLTMEKNIFEENRECLIELFSEKECMIKFLLQIESKMKEASLLLQFEKASFYKDTLTILKYLSSINKSDSLKGRKILVGEKIDSGYKLFYISDENLVLKRKYPTITIQDIEEFLDQGRTVEEHITPYKNEKSNLDFKHIISTEIMSKSSKSVGFVGENFNPELFLNQLLNCTISSHSI